MTPGDAFSGTAGRRGPGTSGSDDGPGPVASHGAAGRPVELDASASVRRPPALAVVSVAAGVVGAVLGLGGIVRAIEQHTAQQTALELLGANGTGIGLDGTTGLDPLKTLPFAVGGLQRRYDAAPGADLTLVRSSLRLDELLV
ncbi:MAG: hypothetical protein ACRCY9_07865, partial [Phycicoccus sp.]